MRYKAFISAILISLVLAVPCSAKRAAPQKVTPVIYEGTRYEAPTDQMGFVVAIDNTTGKKLWEKRIYKVWFKFWPEKDVQTIYITEMRIENQKLIIRNEKDEYYSLDLRTKDVEKHRAR
jgi:outer membrane protein assembly factor BamB